MESVSASSSEKMFIGFLINFVCETKPKDLFTNLDKISKHMLDNMDPKCDENLYRKQYGNLKECVLAGDGIMQVFKLDGTCFRMQKRDHMQECYESGLIEDSAWEKYLEAYDVYLENFLKILKRTNNNVCRKTGKRYHESTNKDGEYEPTYDFSLDEDVMKCKIEY